MVNLMNREYKVNLFNSLCICKRKNNLKQKFFLVFPAPALPKVTNVKKKKCKKLCRFLNIIIDNASNFVSIYRKMKTNAINMRIKSFVMTELFKIWML